MRLLRAVGRFWYEFVIGDDPKIAVGVVAGLAIVSGAMAAGAFGDSGLTVLGGLVLLAVFTLALAVDVRRNGPRRGR